jgi:hypothetical protein
VHEEFIRVKSVQKAEIFTPQRHKEHKAFLRELCAFVVKPALPRVPVCPRHVIVQK